MAGGAAPTPEGYLLFLRGVAGIPVDALPDAAPIIGYSFYAALRLVNIQIAALPLPGPSDQWSAYAWAVFNLATHTLITYAADNPNASDPANRVYFTKLRQGYGLMQFVAGVVQSSADVTTSQSLLIPDAFKGLTIANLGQLKTPFGRAFLEIAQSASPLWGLS